MSGRDFVVELDTTVAQVVEVLLAGSQAGVELDPMAAIVRALQAAGHELDLDALPPMMKMILSGML